jgi:ureidoglycolate hydrolase
MPYYRVEVEVRYRYRRLTYLTHVHRLQQALGGAWRQHPHATEVTVTVIAIRPFGGTTFVPTEEGACA